MNQTARSVVPGIIAGLINGAILLPLIPLALAFYLSVSLEAKLSIANIALILFTIILILRNKFYPQQIRVARSQISHHTYLIQKNVAKHIPDKETFEYLGQIYGFHWGKIEVLPDDVFTKQFFVDSALPSIHPHCQAFYEQKKAQEAEKINLKR